MPEYFLPTEEDRRILQEVVDAVRGGRLVLPGGKGQRRGWPQPDAYMTPDVYVAKTPSGGIPGLTVGAGTGAQEDDEPGRADCDIYRIYDPSTPVLSSLGFQRTVYNLSETAIGGGLWITIQRTKFGEWLAGVDAAQYQARWIEFTINELGGLLRSEASCTIDGVVYHDGYEPDTPVTTVYNVPASSDYIFEGIDNNKGAAIYDASEDKYYIVAIEEQHQARWIKFSATENFTSGEANVTIDGITYYDGYTPDPEPTSVENPGWAGLDNDAGLAFLNTSDGKYYIASMITVATDIMVGHRIDDSNNKKFETLWQQFHMRAAETTTSDWRTDHTGADCP